MTDVVAALIWQGNRFLACQRPAHKARGLLWEFVGGKVEPNESKTDALIRECKEELDVQISVGDIFMEVVHEYPDLTVRLTIFHASIYSGTIQKLEHNDIRWLSVSELRNYDFCPADEEILRRLEICYGEKSKIQTTLFTHQDLQYRLFLKKLIPDVSLDAIIGVRMPVLRSYAAKMLPEQSTDYLSQLPHLYYEENNLHGLLLNKISDYEKLIQELDRFLPFVDNWATCDLLRPMIPQGKKSEFLQQIRIWLSSNHTFTARFAIEMLMIHYRNEDFDPQYLIWAANREDHTYYLNMMIAWYYADVMTDHFSLVVDLLKQGILTKWTHNKAIQKGIESRRLSSVQKEQLLQLKIHRKG